MDKDVFEFWKRNNTPVSLMVKRGKNLDIEREKVEYAAEYVFNEVDMLVHEYPEFKLWQTHKRMVELTLVRNYLKPERLAKRVYALAERANLNGDLNREIEIPTVKRTFKDKFNNWMRWGKWL